ncbi:MAG: (Fe-S)-binding protein [Clostridia bacterium]|nr:(Fe-S)-binding protein [Clostridia bacterium]
MILSNNARKNADSCRFCWMCRHICPIGNATGHERNTARARALSLSMVERGSVPFSADVIANIYECALCGACTKECVTGWDPLTFTREARLAAALDAKLPSYIEPILQNILTYGSPYGEKKNALKEAALAHKEGKILFYLGNDAREVCPDEALKAVKLLEKAGVDFALLEDEPESGAALDFLIGDASETKKAFDACAAALAPYEKVIVLEPRDAKLFRRDYVEKGIRLPEIITLTSLLASLLKEGKLDVKKTEEKLALQDDFNLARELEETEDARAIIAACGEECEMLLNRRDTVFAGSPLMALYMPDVIREVAARRLHNARTMGAETVVAEGASEFAAMKALESDVKVKSIWGIIE